MNEQPVAVETEFVTFEVGGQLFGIDVAHVHEVFRPQAISPVPLARAEIAGVMNLRGRIVTLVCARRRLGLPPAIEGSPAPMALRIERNGESYAVLVDAVGEVLKAPGNIGEAAPSNLDPCWAAVSCGVYRLQGRLLVAWDVDRLLDLGLTAAA